MFLHFLQGILVIGFNRPAAKNSFSKKMVRMMDEAVQSARFDSAVRVLVFRYVGRG